MFDTTDLVSAAEGLRDRVTVLVERAERISTIENREAAALRGGCSDFGTEGEIKGRADFSRRCVSDETEAAASEFRAMFDALLAEMFALDVDEAAALGPLLQSKLTDADLIGLVRSERRSYTLLRCVSGYPDSPFAAELGRRLDGFRSALGKEVDRLLRLAESAVRQPRAGSVFNARAIWPEPVALFGRNVQDAAARLDAFLRGDASTDDEDPFFAAVARYANR